MWNRPMKTNWPHPMQCFYAHARIIIVRKRSFFVSEVSLGSSAVRVFRDRDRLLSNSCCRNWSSQLINARPNNCQDFQSKFDSDISKPFHHFFMNFPTDNSLQRKMHIQKAMQLVQFSLFNEPDQEAGVKSRNVTQSLCGISSWNEHRLSNSVSSTLEFPQTYSAKEHTSEKTTGISRWKRADMVRRTSVTFDHVTCIGASRWVCYEEINVPDQSSQRRFSAD